MRATQTGDVITRTHGSTFTEADERKTITWSTGDRSVIKEYVDADSVIVYDINDRLVQGLTLDPTYRYFN
ncbi:MAG TPA: hypothetical protein VMV77_05290, partial [Bacteroidales bacterium]|nr:hypothetical protein [Bacteroidales bacterium]